MTGLFKIPYFTPLRKALPSTFLACSSAAHCLSKPPNEYKLTYAHGSQRCVQQALDQLGYTTPDTSVIERRNGTARRVSAHQVRRFLAFARCDGTKVALG
jgi:hypothetical protein